ncbi:MAG: MurR/RpiR family transcriptional regulator [Methanocella sp.]
MSQEELKLHVQETLARLSSILPSLRPAEQRLARLILQNPKAAIEMSVSELAREVETSETTAVRLAKALGFKGLREFKLAVATELPGPDLNVYERLRPGETLEDIATTYFAYAVKAFGDTLGLLDLDRLARAIAVLEKASRIGCFGSGASGLVANDAQQKLLRVCLAAWAFVDPHEQLTFATTVSSKDAVIGISHSGYTKDVIAAVGLAKENGARTIAVVGDPHSDLAGLADLVLVAASPEVPLRSGTVLSRLVQLAVIDLLTLGIAARRKQAIMDQFERRRQVLAQRRTKP